MYTQYYKGRKQEMWDKKLAITVLFLFIYNITETSFKSVKFK